MNEPLIILAFMVGLVVASPAEFIGPVALVGICIFLWWLARLR